MIIRFSKSMNLILTYILTAVIFCLFVGMGVSSGQDKALYYSFCCQEAVMERPSAAEESALHVNRFADSETEASNSALHVNRSVDSETDAANSELHVNRFADSETDAANSELRVNGFVDSETDAANSAQAPVNGNGQQVSIGVPFTEFGLTGRIYNEKVAEKGLSSDFCMQKMGSTYVSMAGILQRLASVLFTYTCAILLLFLTDRIPRLCQILFIHRSDGQKSHEMSFVF